MWWQSQRKRYNQSVGIAKIAKKFIFNSNKWSHKWFRLIFTKSNWNTAEAIKTLLQIIWIITYGLRSLADSRNQLQFLKNIRQSIWCWKQKENCRTLTPWLMCEKQSIDLDIVYHFGQNPDYSIVCNVGIYWRTPDGVSKSKWKAKEPTRCKPYTLQHLYQWIQFPLNNPW